MRDIGRFCYINRTGFGRYAGDETNQIPNEELLRKKLQEKIDKRKRENEVSVDEQNNFSHKVKKKSDPGSAVESSVLEESGNVGSKRKQKKYIDVNKVLESENNLFLESPNNTDKTVNKKKKDEILKSENHANNDKIFNHGISVSDKFESQEKQTSFTILGNISVPKKEKVKRKLPNWLANPSVVSVDLKNLTCSVDSFPNLNKIFITKLKENGITHFFPVQSQIIPWLLENAERPRMYWPNDICVSAPTGSGKTLAFVLPILQILHKRIIPKIRALVVLPVQDLANQVFSVFETYSKPTNLNVLLLTKKRPFKEEQSLICKIDGMQNYKTMVDIVVTTPGRLVDHLTKTKGLSLDSLTYLVIDEADRVMENVQNDWLYHLNKHINSECIRSYQNPIISYNSMNRRQPPHKLLFSATLSQDPEKLKQLGLFQPKLFTSVVKSKYVNGNENRYFNHENYYSNLQLMSDKKRLCGVIPHLNFNGALKFSTESHKCINFLGAFSILSPQNCINNDDKDETKFIGKYTTPAELTEYYINCTKANKPLILHHLIKCKSWKNVLCFVNSAEATSRLAFVLKAISKKGIKIGKLSSNINIRKRDTVLKKFSRGEINVLVSSDALARGMDIPNVQYVISYDAPKFIKTYIHRIGRTGRAGREGTSVTFLTPKEKNNFQKMIEIAGKTSVQELNINEKELEEYHNSFEKALKSLGSFLEKKKQRSLLKLKAKKKLQMKFEKGKFLKKKN